MTSSCGTFYEFFSNLPNFDDFYSLLLWCNECDSMTLYFNVQHEDEITSRCSKCLTRYIMWAVFQTSCNGDDSSIHCSAGFSSSERQFIHEACWALNKIHFDMC